MIHTKKTYGKGPTPQTRYPHTPLKTISTKNCILPSNLIKMGKCWPPHPPQKNTCVINRNIIDIFWTSLLLFFCENWNISLEQIFMKTLLLMFHHPFPFITLLHQLPKWSKKEWNINFETRENLVDVSIIALVRTTQNYMNVGPLSLCAPAE